MKIIDFRLVLIIFFWLKKVVSNKGVAGVDGISVEELHEYLKQNKDKLLSDIRNRKYKPQPVKRVEIPKENGKMRKLGIPTVVDRVIQQAMSQVLVPIYEEQFSDSSSQDNVFHISLKSTKFHFMLRYPPRKMPVCRRRLPCLKQNLLILGRRFFIIFLYCIARQYTEVMLSPYEVD